MLREGKRVGRGEEVLSAECWEKRRISWQLAREEESWQLAVGSGRSGIGRSYQALSNLSVSIVIKSRRVDTNM